MKMNSYVLIFIMMIIIASALALCGVMKIEVLKDPLLLASGSGLAMIVRKEE